MYQRLPLLVVSLSASVVRLLSSARLFGPSNLLPEWLGSVGEAGVERTQADWLRRGE